MFKVQVRGFDFAVVNTVTGTVESVSSSRVRAQATARVLNGVA